MSSNYPYDPSMDWWTGADPATQDASTPNPLMDITPYTGARLPSAGSFRLANAQAALQARQQLEQRLFPQQAAANGNPDAAGQMASVGVAPAPQPPQAQSWWAAPGTPLGDFERNVTRGNLLSKGLNLLELGGKALGSLAQGAENVAGSVVGMLPQVRVLGGGQVSIKPGVNQQMLDKAAQLQAQTGGQDYSAKYRNATPLLEQPIGGNDPASWAMTQAQNIAYSGAGTNQPAQVNAVSRMIMGEDPTVVMRGLAEPGTDAYGDEITHYQTRAQEYVDAAGRRAKAEAMSIAQLPDPRWGTKENYAAAMEQAAREKAAQWITATKRIPGEEDPTKEMIGQIVLDPMQLAQVAKAQEILLKPVIGKLKGTTQAVERVTTVYNDTLKAQVAAVKTGINPRIQALSETVGKAADARGNNVILDTLDRMLKRGVNMFTYTPQTQAKVLTGVAYQQLGNMATTAESGQEMATMLRTYVDNPQALVERLGVVPTSVDAEVARPVVRDAMEKLQALPSLQAGKEFNPADFLMQADEILRDASKKLAKVPDKLPTWQAWNQTLKSWMSEFMLRTPGYVVRNYISDTAIATMDGLRMFENMDTVTRDLERFGVSTRRLMSTGIAGEEMGSKLAGIPGVGAIQTKIGEIAESGERSRFTRAYWSALTDFLGTNWKPAVSAQTRALFEAAGHGDLIDEMEGALKGARSGKDIRARMLSVLDSTTPADRFFVTQHVGANDLPTDVAAWIESDLRRMASEGRSIDEVNAYMDDWAQKLSEHTKAKMVDLGPVISPRDTTAQDALLDVEESVRAYQRDIGRAMNHGDIKPEEATQLIDTFKKEQEARARAVHAARQELTQAIGSLGQNVDEAHVAAVLHAIDGEYDLRNDTRVVVDEIRRKAWADQNPSRALWEQYRADVGAAWGEAGNQTIQKYKDAAAALREIAAGGDLVEVMGKYGIKGVTARAEAALEAARATIATAGLEGFDRGLADARVAWDTARNESRRRLIQMVQANPALAQDGFDAFRAAERDVQRRWDMYIAKKNELLALKDADKINLEQYGKMLGEEADKAFAFSTKRHGELLVAQLEGIEIGKSEVARRLRELGYSGDELKRLSMLQDDATKAEVGAILKEGKRAPTAPEYVPDATGAAQAPQFNEMNPPATADELLATIDRGDSEEQHLQGALDQARRNQYTAEGLAQGDMVGDARAATKKGQLPTVREINQYLRPDGTLKGGDLGPAMDEIGERFGAVFDDNVVGGRDESFRLWLEQSRNTRTAGRAATGATVNADDAAQAYEQWRSVAEELQARLDKVTGASAEMQGMRVFVRENVQTDGLAQASQTIRAIASGGTEMDNAMLQELALVAREHAQAALDAADDVIKAHADVERILAQALLGETDVMDLSRARDLFRKQAGIPIIPGLEHETQIDTIRAMATALGLNPDDFVKGERGIQDVIKAAMEAYPDVTRDVLALETTADGRATVKSWDAFTAKYGDQGNPSKPGQVLKELASHVEQAATAVNVTSEARRAEIAARAAGVTTLDELKAAVPEGVLVMKNSDPGGITVFVTDRKNGIVIEGHGANGQEALDDALKQLGVEVKPRSATPTTPKAPTTPAVPVPQNVLDAEARADAARKKVSQIKQELTGAVDQVKASRIKVRLEQAEAEAKTAGMQAASARKKAGVLPPSQRGTAPATTTAPNTDELSAEQLVELDTLRTTTPNTDAPSMDDHITAAERQQVDAINKIKAGLAQKWNTALNGAPLPANSRQVMEAEIKRVARQWQELRAAAIAHSEARANFSLLDYGSKRGIDMMISAVAPYAFWGTRQGRNFAIRIMANPQMMVNFLRYKEAMKKENIRRGYRQRFEGGWEIPLGNGEYSVFIDPTAMMFPFADLIKADFSDSSEAKSTMAQIYDAAGSLGLRPAPWIDIPLRMSNLMVDAQPGTPEYDTQVQGYGKESVGQLIPQAAMLKGATALAGIGTPGGIDAERPIRAALGMPQGQPFEPYTLARSVRDLAVEAQVAAQRTGGQFSNQSYLIAQAAIATYGNERYADLLEKATPAELAKELNITVPEATGALQIVRDAARRAGAQKGISTLTSGLLGQRMQVMTPGERYYGQMQQAERSQAYSPYTGTGSRADVLAAREAMPALAVGSAQYATLPGETRDPREIATNARKDEIYKSFAQLTDAVISNRPWDQKSVRVISDARSQALDMVGSKDAADWRTVYAKTLAVLAGQQPEDATAATTYTARSIAGANPTEAEQIRKDEVLRYVAATRPQFEQFLAASGMPDYAAYSAATAQWETLLPKIASQSPVVAQVIAQAQTEGKNIGAWTKTISQADIKKYWSRNDSAAQAAQRAYFDQVYTPATTSAKKGTKVNVARLPAGGAVDTAGLVDLVMQQYPGRWTKDQLKQELGGMSMPDLRTVAIGQMSATAQQKQSSEDSFTAYVAQKYGARGAQAYQAYTGAADAEEKAKIRKRYAVLAKVLAARTEYMAQQP